ncbi:meiosis-specific with OB domain-containing protein [Pararge aegeria]|uniref:Jg25885 protein n=1 Tax=Pararge aegeria aegeria TaxID=348720 RepID=A0A8S4RRH0_9NEOP|nr:meiosis-specific with OB domain-containing protein [Pararge aegeria]CAH2240344.1 jg25885 [Pararge aegeria aegeria]
MAGVQKVCLSNLNINFNNALIVGIIIAKNSPRTIGSKKKNGESRGVMSFTLRDSNIDTINADVWGSEYFVTTFYERFLVGDVVAISNPKICIKSGDNEIYRPQATSPFYLSLNEGASDMCIFDGDTFGSYLPLLHIPTKPCAGYCGLSEVMKITEQTNNVYVDLLVVVKAVKPAKTIRTKAGTDMTVCTVEIMDNTTPASLILDIFDIDTIQRTEQWRPLESVLFIADVRVSWRSFAVRVQTCSRSVVTHQPHTPEAESLRLYIRNQANTRGGEAAAWAAWSGERANTASVSQIRDRLSNGAPFCAALHALLTHLDLDEFVTSKDGNLEELRVRFADHTGELNARMPVNVVEDAFGYTVDQFISMSASDRASIRWRYLLEQCSTKIAVTPPRLIVLCLRRASPADPIPLY